MLPADSATNSCSRMNSQKENEGMRNVPAPQQIYRHFKGNLYQIITLAEDSESGEMLVVYQAMYEGFKVYARPLSMFLSKVDREKYPDAVQKYRFEQVNASKTCFGPKAVVTEEEITLDPLVLEFLDADTFEQRINILAALHDRITDDMITTMAVAVDVEVKEGTIEQRYEDLKNCLLLYDKFECNRMR